MIINGTMSDIKVKRTRNYFRNATVEINCPDYRLSGEFSPYKRLADFLWENLAQYSRSTKGNRGKTRSFFVKWATITGNFNSYW